MSAYVLVSVEPARTQEVLDRLRTIPHAIVREVLGPYDMIVELEADTSEKPCLGAGNAIRHTRGVTNTVTCMWLEG